MESKNFFLQKYFSRFPVPVCRNLHAAVLPRFLLPICGRICRLLSVPLYSMDDIEEIIFDESLDEEDENYYNGGYDDNRNDNNPQDNRPDGGTGCLGIVSAIVIMILLLSLLL